MAEPLKVYLSWQAGWRDYLSLCKPRVVMVMLLTALVGMFLATPGLPPMDKVLLGNLGIGLAAASAAAINQILDRHLDARMARTRGRPLPGGRIHAFQAISFATVLGVCGISLLALAVNPLCAWLTLGSLVGYAVIYTAFLKRATPQNIVIGGLAGAAPPLLGWVAISGTWDPHALLLVLIIFTWTPPHFWALCLHKRDEYARAGIPMLPVTHGSAHTRLQILLYTLLLWVSTWLPFVTGMSGLLYLVGVMGLNLRFLQWAWRLYRGQDSGAALALFRHSIHYILGLFLVLLLDHHIPQLSARLLSGH